MHYTGNSSGLYIRCEAISFSISLYFLSQNADTVTRTAALTLEVLFPVEKRRGQSICPIPSNIELLLILHSSHSGSLSSVCPRRPGSNPGAHHRAFGSDKQVK